MANLNRKWRRVTAIGCSHGDLAHQGICKQVLSFVARYKPDYRIDLGDDFDTAAFRSGARGTPDEAKEIAPDFNMGIRWIEMYEPTHITSGNHDWRLVELMNSPNAIVAHAAATLWNDFQKAAQKVGAKTKPYDYEHGCFDIGGVIWTHGYWYNESAVRDHAEYYGKRVVMAHLHVPQVVQGRTRANTESYCVGMLGDPDKFTYARRRRATSRWAHGVVWGEITEGKNAEAHLCLTSCPKGGTLHFPV